MENDQYKQLMLLNDQCLDLLESESYENLLSLFEQRDKLTKAIIVDCKNTSNNNILQQLYDYDNLIVAKIIEKKADCSENLSVFYRRHNAKNEYIETHKNIINC